jgi:hypothetical protein
MKITGWVCPEHGIVGMIPLGGFAYCNIFGCCNKVKVQTCNIETINPAPEAHTKKES